MDNKINPRLSPEYGNFEFVPRKPAEASPLPIGNTSNSAEAPGRPASPETVSGKPDLPQANNAKAKKHLTQESDALTLSGKKLKPAEALPLLADSDFDIEEGYHTPEDVKKSVPILPGAPRIEYKDTDKSVRPRSRCMNFAQYFASLESQENSSATSDSGQSSPERKKPR